MMSVWHLNNIPTGAIELADERHSPVDALEESAWPHCPANLELAEIIGDIKKTALKLDTRYIFANIRAVTRGLLDVSHVHALQCSKPEQLRKGPQPSDSDKQVIDWNPYLRPTESIRRRIEQPIKSNRLTRAPLEAAR